MASAVALARGNMPDPPIIAGVERALRERGFFILRRFYTKNGDCVIRFRAMAGPFVGFRLDHELLIASQDAGPGASLQTDALAETMAYVDTHSAEMAPFAKALRN